MMHGQRNIKSLQKLIKQYLQSINSTVLPFLTYFPNFKGKTASWHHLNMSPLTKPLEPSERL